MWWKESSFFLKPNKPVIYSGDSQVEIGPGSNPVTIDVAPAVPMVRIAPYELLTAASATFTSKLEIWNIPEFRSGSFTIQLDPTQVTFVGASAANEDWGTLEIGSEVVENELTLTVSSYQRKRYRAELDMRS